MWQRAPKKFNLEPKQVHVWKANVSHFQKQYNSLINLLSEEELKRASKFRFKKDKDTYVVGKGLLRILLGKYLVCNPAAINFKHNPQSKPFIESTLDLQFNVSHSKQAILFAFTLKHAIGVDVEYSKRQVEVSQIASLFFSEKEAKALLALKESEWLSTFYNCWTRKEAFIKAKGGGLSIPLDQFEVSLIENDTPELRYIEWDQEDVANWKMEAFTMQDTYTGAVIVNNNSAFFNYYNGDLLQVEQPIQ